MFRVERTTDGKMLVRTDLGKDVTIDINWDQFSDQVDRALRTVEKEALASRQRATTSGRAPEITDGPAPGPIDPTTGQHTDYWVLPAEERAKGFIRPVRHSYIHVGTRPKYPLRPMTDEEKRSYGPAYEFFEDYPESERPVVGRGWTKEQISSGCQGVTSMGQSIAETYARNPTYYSATFCCHCMKHLPVGPSGEFVWEDGSRVGT